MIVSGCVHRVTRGRRENNRFGSGGTPERGRSWAGATIPVSRSVGVSAVGAAPSGLKLGGLLYTPVCNARSEWHSIAHVRQTIVPFMRFRNLRSSMPCLLIQSKYLPYIVSAIWGARNLMVKSYMRSAISHVRPSPMAGTNLISMGWAHEPVPF